MPYPPPPTPSDPTTEALQQDLQRCPDGRSGLGEVLRHRRQRRWAAALTRQPSSEDCVSEVGTPVVSQPEDVEDRALRRIQPDTPAPGQRLLVRPTSKVAGSKRCQRTGEIVILGGWLPRDRAMSLLVGISSVRSWMDRADSRQMVACGFFAVAAIRAAVVSAVSPVLMKAPGATRSNSACATSCSRPCRLSPWRDRSPYAKKSGSCRSAMITHLSRKQATSSQCVRDSAAWLGASSVLDVRRDTVPMTKVPGTERSRDLVVGLTGFEPATP